jgi:ribosomal protein S18 acetylase RimI-like enzyme
MRWKRASKRDLPELIDFLRRREWRAVPFTSRLRRQGRAVFPARLEASILICRRSSGICAVMMLTSTGLLLPIFSAEVALLAEDGAAQDGKAAVPPGPFPGWKDLPYRLYSLMGPRAEVSWMEEILPARPRVSIDYHLMIQSRDSFMKQRRKSATHFPGLVIRTAYPQDLLDLLPLQIHYELEEVVVSKKRYSAQVCRQNLKRSLRQQLILMAVLKGKVVAKAGTNARGFRTDQIGGVFTAEDVRKTGIAYRVMEELLKRIFAEKPMVCLFVKETNLPALSLYRKLGFLSADRYRISYFRD